jgi:hypothetical protein
MAQFLRCPYCDFEVFFSRHIVCRNCSGEMRPHKVSSVEHRTTLNNGQDFYIGVILDGTKMGFSAPVGCEEALLSTQVHAVCPVNGLSKNKPLTVLYAKGGDLSEIPQSHPQTRTLFTRFFIQGLTYSALGNSVAYVLLRPPVWQFLISLLLFVGIYVFSSRKIIATGESRKKGIKKQIQLSNGTENDDN